MNRHTGFSVGDYHRKLAQKGRDGEYSPLENPLPSFLMSCWITQKLYPTKSFVNLFKGCGGLGGGAPGSPIAMGETLLRPKRAGGGCKALVLCSMVWEPASIYKYMEAIKFALPQTCPKRQGRGIFPLGEPPPVFPGKLLGNTKASST